MTALISCVHCWNTISTLQSTAELSKTLCVAVFQVIPGSPNGCQLCKGRTILCLGPSMEQGTGEMNYASRMSHRAEKLTQQS